MISPPNKTSLPIDAFLPKIIENFRSKKNLIISAAPGSGKTTRLPPALLGACSGKIIVLEPRKMAAIAAAHRVADENAWTLGTEVGYQVRFQNCSQESTRLVFMTEALFLRKLLQDQELTGIGAVILDEFHERSSHLDLVIAVIKEMQDLGHPVHLIVMSATLDIPKILGYLEDAEVIEVPGQNKSLKIIHAENPLQLLLKREFYSAVIDGIKRVWGLARHDILVFLPGTGEINRLYEDLESWATVQDCVVLRLHGKLSLAEQKSVILPGRNDGEKSRKRRIILTTNIAESSVTIEGVDAVIDTGIARISGYNEQLGITSLNIRKISKSSATQRSGRACRQYDGIALRLWTPRDEASMADHDIAEIMRADLAPVVLTLSKLRIRDFTNFSWFQAPPTGSLTAAIRKLSGFSAIDAENGITKVGLYLLDYPTDLRLARLMLEAKKLGTVHLAALICALLEERDILPRDFDYDGIAGECDLAFRINLLIESGRSGMSRQIHRGQISQVLDVAADLSRSAGVHDFAIAKIVPTEQKIQRLLLAAFADRICRRREGSDRALMVGGRGIKLSPQSAVRKSEFFFAISMVDSGNQSESLVSLASGLDRRAIDQEFGSQIITKSEITFDKDKNRVICRDFKSLNDLALEEGQTRALSEEECGEFLPEILHKNFGIALGSSSSLHSLWQRLDYLRSVCEKLPTPLQEIAIEFFREESFQTWHLNGCRSALVGEKNIDAAVKKELLYYFESTLDPQLRHCLTSELPEKMQVPSGTRLKIHYEIGKDPFIEVRIQEVFGWQSAPRLLFTRLPLTLHLLGPNFRPVQITTNLESFWSTGYAEVRKELRSRYPKHQWPEDPRQGVPEARGKRRGT
jgi:ATP-dependent helicase HrpB